MDNICDFCLKSDISIDTLLTGSRRQRNTSNTLYIKYMYKYISSQDETLKSFNVNNEQTIFELSCY